ncbi:hypothetical protein EK21DRAFT_103357 [Setomelanomma holmii]|uniref:BTB domain-containing protein n=1 Tax=Setomelanomma holmii TaxID=210430 RepID=A0A9P4H378_9PLEO|nr:hypothetical protein EK21DRAFT_103357 [Setomelanomma holmii]
MAPIIHEIDPKADTVIILRNPSTAFAPWPQVEEVHYRVSSRHLMLASPVFMCALEKDGWSESVPHQDDGLFHITADDWDPQALLVLLLVLHSRNRKVKRTVSLNRLAKLATLVDYYDCVEACGLFTCVWLNNLEKTTKAPTTYCRDLILWIWISWVFKENEAFKRSTKTAIEVTNETLQTLDLPIPSRSARYFANHTLCDIDCRRYQVIESVVSQLHDLLDTYRSSKYECPDGTNNSFQCGAIMLGALTKQLDGMALLSPRLEVPFPGLSFAALCTKAKSMKSPAWSARVSKIVDDVGALVQGLEVSEYTGSATNGKTKETSDPTQTPTSI